MSEINGFGPDTLDMKRAKVPKDGENWLKALFTVPRSVKGNGPIDALVRASHVMRSSAALPIARFNLLWK